MKITKKLLYKLYWHDNKSLQDIAKIYKYSLQTIWRWMKKYNINRRAIINSAIIFLPEELEIIHGGLLGDGCLNIQKTCKNARFMHVSKFRLYETHLQNKLNFLKNRKIQKNYDSNGILTYCNYSLTSPTLTKIYSQWYLNGVKHIWPKLKLTQNTLLYWYLDDGSLTKRNGTIILHTDSFPKKEQEQILLPQLNKLGFEARLHKHGIDRNGERQYIISIPRRNVTKFLNYIGPRPKELQKCFGYKWKQKGNK